jgi:hypothetical protein
MNRSGKRQARILCIGCGALVPDVEGPTFRYPDAASPGCWAIYGEILAKEYGAYGYPPVHRLTVDAYAVQHPGRPTPQTAQSVTLHLISLCLVLEQGAPTTYATRMMQHVAENYKRAFPWLDPPPSLGDITVLDVVNAAGYADHARRVRRWAQSTWAAWSVHHDTIRAWITRSTG